MRAAVVVLALCASWIACSGAATQVALAPTPPPQTSGGLAGNLCTADGCTCRDPNAPGDGGVGAPPPGKKRFELRSKSSQPLWASTTDGSVFYKSAERVESCFYFDLATGDRPIRLRASEPSGVSARWDIHEYSPEAKSWYDTFHFECGQPGVCSFADLDEAKERNKQVKKGLYDPCGSVRVRDLTWNTGHSPDQLHPSELQVDLVLDVYKYPAHRPHGDPSCGKGKRGDSQFGSGAMPGSGDGGDSGEGGAGAGDAPPAP